MEEKNYTEMRKLEDTYWWFVGKRMFIFNFIKNGLEAVLDVGCGTGAMIERLSRISKNVIGIDDDFLAISYAKRRTGTKKLVICDAHFISMKDNTFDLIIVSDLLEHIKEDETVLNEVTRVLKSGARLIVTVPAFTFLWGRHDEVVHHMRRYNINLLKRKIQKANLNIEKISYTNILTFPFVFLARNLKRLMPFYRESKTDFFIHHPF